MKKMLFLITLTFVLFACKKETTQREPTLIAKWTNDKVVQKLWDSSGIINRDSVDLGAGNYMDFQPNEKVYITNIKNYNGPGITITPGYDSNYYKIITSDSFTVQNKQNSEPYPMKILLMTNNKLVFRLDYELFGQFTEVMYYLSK